MLKITGRDLTNQKKVKYSFNMPSNWEELSPEQTANILMILTFTKADTYTLNVSVLLIVVGYKHIGTLGKMEIEDVHTLAGIINWVFTTRPPAINKFPTLILNAKQCISPSHSLGNICFGEWCFAYEFYSLYGKSNNIKFLDQLIATLYRPKIKKITIEDQNYTGDLRSPFNENLIDLRAKAVSTIKEEWKLTILTWFTSALIEQMEKRPNVFPAKEVQETEQKVEENKEEDNRTWLTIFRELIGPKFGTTDQLKFTNAMFVLDYLEEQNIAYEDAKKAMNS